MTHSGGRRGSTEPQIAQMNTDLETGQKVTASNIDQLPQGSVVMNGDGSRIIHLHDGLWLWCCDGAWCYDYVDRMKLKLDSKATACHVAPNREHTDDQGQREELWGKIESGEVVVNSDFSITKMMPGGE
jgi:hypothetical protein